MSHNTSYSIACYSNVKNNTNVQINQQQIIQLRMLTQLRAIIRIVINSSTLDIHKIMLDSAHESRPQSHLNL